jgi:PAS domain S-box-containing protein
LKTTEPQIINSFNSISYNKLLQNAISVAFYRCEIINNQLIRKFDEKIVELTGYTEDYFNNEYDLWNNNVHEEDYDLVKCEQEEIWTKDNIELIYRWKCADGQYKWFLDKSELIKDVDGNPKEIFGLIVDINERNRVKKEFETNRLFTQKILKTIPGILFIIDLNKDRIIYSNFPEFKFLGYNEEEILQQGEKIFSEIICQDDKPKLINLLSELNALPDGTVKETEIRIRDKAGKYFWFLVKITIFKRDETNKAAQLIGLLENKHKDKIVKDKLEESEQSYKNLFNTISDAIFIQDYDWTFIDVNDGAVSFFGYTREELIEKNPEFISSGDENDIDEIKRKFEFAKSNVSQKIEFVGKKKDKTKIFTEVQIFKGIYFGKNVIIAQMRDITNRKKSELKMQAALSDKNVLLKEVHHRVKNNLQAMIYLIEMQIDKLEDKNVEMFLRELQEQARTMSLVYEQLYQSDHPAKIDMENYLKSLTSHVFQAFASGREIICNVEAENVILNVEAAMPCGLIVNELLTNSLKYAFNDLTDGAAKLNVKLSKNNNLIEIIVMDNGKGIPQNFNWENTESLGLKLVNYWVKYQLAGSIELDTTSGTKFNIKFENV